MSSSISPNGADADRSTDRPGWYVPLKPIPPDAPTAEEALLSLRVVTDLEELGEAAEDIDHYLEQFLSGPGSE